MRVGSLGLVGVAGLELSTLEARQLSEHGVRGVLLLRHNVRDRDQLQRLCAQLHDAIGEGTGRRACIAVDQEGGAVAPLAAAVGAPPAAATLGNLDDPDLTRRVHRHTASGLHALGIDLALSPVADVDRAGNPVIATRAFSRRSEVVSRHVGAAIAGLREGGVRSCAKHWPGHGATLVDSHRDRPRLSLALAEWRSVDRPPFAAAIAGGVDAVMVGHLELPAFDQDRPFAPSSSSMLTRELREVMGFPGVIVSDALEMGGFGSDRPADALRAGCDLLIWARPIQSLADSLLTVEADLGRDLDVVLERAQGFLSRWETRLAPSSSPAEPSAWDEALERSLDFAPEKGLTFPGRWALLDFASRDRLLRVPGVGEDPVAAALDSGAVSGSVLMEPACEVLGPSAVAPLVRAAPGDGGDASGLPDSAFQESPSLDGLVVASLRPLDETTRRRVEELAERKGVRWALLAGAPALEGWKGLASQASVGRCAEARPGAMAGVLRQMAARATAASGSVS